MEKIGIEEIQGRILSIAKEFDKICCRHQIPYYMLGGTMLGAIRHKGFIPWDDDMDFGVPIKQKKKLMEYLEKELPYPYRCCSFRNHPAVVFNFLKIEDTTTCIDDLTVALPMEQQLGVNIDIFPLNRCTLNGKKERRVRLREDMVAKAFVRSTTHPNNLIIKVLKGCLRFLLGGSLKHQQRLIDKKLMAINSGESIGNLLGRWGEREIIPEEWYGDGVRYQFEDYSFIGLEKYDAYLTRLYGNYMELPPANQRIAHVDNVYVR